MRGGAPSAQQKTHFQSQEVQGITVYIDPQIRLAEPDQPLGLHYAGWWIFRSLELSNAVCAWPGEE